MAFVREIKCTKRSVVGNVDIISATHITTLLRISMQDLCLSIPVSTESESVSAMKIVTVIVCKHQPYFNFKNVIPRLRNIFSL